MRPRIKSKVIIASSKEERVNWVRTSIKLFPKVKQVFCYNDKGINLAPVR